MVCAKSVCVLCTLEQIPVASHRFRVHDETTIWSATRDDGDPVGKLAIRFLSCPGWSMEQPFCHLHSEIRQKVHSTVLSCQQILRFRPLSRRPWCRASKTIACTTNNYEMFFNLLLARINTFFNRCFVFENSFRNEIVMAILSRVSQRALWLRLISSTSH